MLKTGRSLVRFLFEVIGIFNRRNPSDRTVALVPTQPLTEISTRNLLGTDNLAATCKPILEKVWELRRFTTLWPSMDCYR
jgi:hypothetical protein